jgi:hypothetical protein
MNALNFATCSIDSFLYLLLFISVESMYFHAKEIFTNNMSGIWCGGGISFLAIEEFLLHVESK